MVEGYVTESIRLTIRAALLVHTQVSEKMIHGVKNESQTMLHDPHKKVKVLMYGPVYSQKFLN